MDTKVEELFTPEAQERVQVAGYTLSTLAAQLTADIHPICPIAALTMAAAHAALLTEVPYEDLVSLLKLHYEAAVVGLAARAAEEAGQAVHASAKPREG